MLNKSAETVTK